MGMIQCGEKYDENINGICLDIRVYDIKELYRYSINNKQWTDWLFAVYILM